MVTREDDWDSPSEGERKSVWDETERKYMVDLRSEEDAENKKIEEDFQLLNYEVMRKFSELEEQRSQLKELRSRLARDLAQAETELEHITNECKETASRLERIEQDYHSSRQKTTETFHDKRSKMRRFFRQKRGENPDTPDHLGPESEGIVLPEMLPEVSSGFNGTTPQVEPTNGTAVVAERPEEEEEEDDDDCIIVGGDPFQKCGNYEWNRQGCHGSSGDTIDIPASRERVQRKKQLEDGAQETSPQYPELPSERQAGRETERQPERQYERQLDQRPERPAEPQPAPQTECQAGWTTAQQPKRRPEHQPEKVPDRPDERFHDFIFAEAPERTAEVATIQIAERPHEMSHGSASRSSTGPPSRSATALRLNYAPERMIDPVDSPLPTPIYPRTGLSETSHSMLPSGVLRHPRADFNPAHTSSELEKIHAPHECRTAAGFTPANVRSRPPSSDRGRPTPQSLSLGSSLQPPKVPSSQLLEEITRENMVLQNNGNVYTHPECMVGVPLVKIHKNHPYWKTSWPSLEKLIKQQLARRREELQAIIQAGPKEGQTGTILDEINRGNKILKFLENWPISPYQLLGKKYIKSDIQSFNVLFRLSETISELEDFNLDISPVEWIRQRLHELIQTNGVSFNLAQTLKSLYQDFKLTSLRWKNEPDNRGGPTPPSLSVNPSSHPPESHPAQPLEEITRENMVLKHDENVYTYPECVAGVPLVKINEEHPYWEANWPNVKKFIELRLDQQREKRQKDATEADTINRKIDQEINRCEKTREFFENWPISPHQLLGKKYIKHGIKSFNALFRLSETISELEDFNLDIPPVEWIRQRLHELIQTQVDTFKLTPTLEKLHRDPKLASLRLKNGFDNRGRRSTALSLGSPSNTTKPLQKRKSMHSVPTTPREASFFHYSPLPSQVPPNYPAPAPGPASAPVSAPVPQPAFSTHLSKKPKYMPPTYESPVHDEFHFEAWSDTDSCSGGSITKYDWRLAVVKTRWYTSHINVTQYWSWIVQTQCFQHQVLKDIKPAKWGLFKDEIDFHVNLAEIEEMEWSIEALRVHIIMKKDARELAADGKPRGDVMASFPRARTMRRFLFFCRERGMNMAKRAPEQLNTTWDSMVSEQLPGRGDSNQQLVE